MEIINIKVLRGPNYWSISQKELIVIKLDIGTNSDDEVKSALLSSPLKTLFPITHQTLLNKQKGKNGLPHIIQGLIKELHGKANSSIDFSLIEKAHEPDVFFVIFSYESEGSGVYAANAVVNMVNCFLQNKPYTDMQLKNDIQKIEDFNQQQKLGPSTQVVVEEAKKRGIPVHRYKDSSLVTLGHGCYQKKIWATITSETSAVGVDIVSNKQLTKRLLADNFLPTTEGITIRSAEELEEAINLLGFPLAIKPENGNHGRGVTTDIKTKEKALFAFQIAQKFSNDVIVERFVHGDDYRILVINYKVVAVAKRIPARIIGDGEHTIQELIDQTNQDPRRGNGHENYLTTIVVDEATHSILQEKGLTLQSVLSEKKILSLKYSANLSSGGSSINVTHTIHPFNIALAERAAKLMNLDICGLDVVAEDIQSPITKKNGAIIEINASPGLRMHVAPNEGKPQNVAKPILDMLYPPSTPFRIPTVAVTGTNGKTTVVRLIAHLAKQLGYQVGLTTTEGIYINDDLLYKGDCSGPTSAFSVLHNPLVDFAVLECARGGILRSGLGFEQCDVGIVMNIAADHLGIEDIHTLEDLTRVKSIVPKSVHPNGYAILNGADPEVISIENELTCYIAYFALQENERITNHCRKGGLAAYVKKDRIIVQQGDDIQTLGNIKEIPLTFNGTATPMIENILAATLAGVINNFPLFNIEHALSNFYPSVENTPGRMNVFHFGNFKIMLDYAHNEDAYIQLKDFLKKTPCSKKIGIIAATGDRRSEDIENLGYRAAEIFDEIIIRHNKDGRGRSRDELTLLLKKGIKRSSAKPQVTVISDEIAAVRHAIAEAVPDAFIHYSADNVFDAVDFMMEEKIQFERSL